MLAVRNGKHKAAAATAAAAKTHRKALLRAARSESTKTKRMRGTKVQANLPFLRPAAAAAAAAAAA